MNRIYKIMVDADEDASRKRYSSSNVYFNLLSNVDL